MKSKPQSPASSPLKIYSLPLLATSLCFVIAYHFFFTLKPAAHWDEIKRYYYAGVYLPSFNLEQLWQTFSLTINNGRAVTFILRIVRNFTPNDLVIVEYSYKCLILLFSTLALVWFSRKTLAITCYKTLFFIVGLYLLAPMTWIQANELMTEPLALPLSLFWLGCAAPFLDFKNLKAKDKWFLSLGLFLSGIALALTSLQYFMIYAGLAGLAILILLARDFIQDKNQRSVKAVLYNLIQPTWVAIAIIFVVAAWWALPPYAEPSLKPPFVSWLFKTSSTNWHATARGLTDFDFYICGMRAFFWIYFPTLLLLPLTLWGFFNKRKTLTKSQWFVLIVTVINITITAYAYKVNANERYRHPANVLLLIVMGYFTFVGLQLLWQRFQTKPLLQKSIFTLILLYSFCDYLPLYQHLPSLASIQSGVPYTGFDKVSHTLPSTFYLIPRENLISFSRLDDTFYFPNKTKETPHKDYFKIIKKIKAHLKKGYSPIVLQKGSPNYFTTETLNLWYLARFGSPVPDFRTNTHLTLFSLGFSKNSIFYSASYGITEGKSDERTLKEWQRFMEFPTLHVQVDENNDDYFLRIADLVVQRQ